MLGSLFKIGQGIKQNKMAKKINPIWQQYQESPYAGKQLGIAQQMFNGPMAGRANLESGILGAGSNAVSNAMRNATDGSQGLVAAIASQGQTNNALQGLQTAEAQNKYSMLGNLNNAYGQMIGEGHRVHQSIMDKYMMDMQQKMNLQGAGAQNIAGGIDDIESQAIQVAGMMGGFGGLGGLFGKKGGGGFMGGGRGAGQAMPVNF